MHEGKTTGLTVYKTVFVTNQSDVLWRKTGLEKTYLYMYVSKTM